MYKNDMVIVLLHDKYINMQCLGIFKGPIIDLPSVLMQYFQLLDQP